jgi:serine/threonine-protein kinase
MGGRHRIRSTLALVCVLTGSLLWSHAASASTRSYSAAKVIAGVSLDDAQGIAVDSSGNVYVSDAGNGRVLELATSRSRSGPVTALPFGALSAPGDVGVDASGSVFVVDGDGVTELPKTAAGFGPQLTLPFQGLSRITDLAVDAAGDVFVVAVRGEVFELPVTPTGYGAQSDLPFVGIFAVGVAVDRSGDVFAVGNGELAELPAVAGGYGPQQLLPSVGIGDVTSIAVDGAGDVFAGSDATGGVVDELTKTPSGWAASAQSVYLYLYSSQTVSALAVDAMGDLLATGSTGQGLASEAVELGASHLRPTSRHFGSVPATVLPFGGVNVPTGLAVDGAGDLFVADSATPIFEGDHHSWLANVVEYPKGGNPKERVVPFQGLNVADGLAADSAGDVFAAAFGPRGADVIELPKAAKGFGAQTTVPFGDIVDGYGDLVTASGLAVDASGDVFLSWNGDEGLDAGVAEVPAVPGGYGPCVELPLVSAGSTTGIAADPKGDVFVTEHGVLLELPKTPGGFAPQVTVDGQLPTGPGSGPEGITIDGAGDILVADAPAGDLIELPPLPTGYGPPVTLPGTGIAQPDQVAVDGRGDVFAAGTATPSSGRFATVAELPSHP